MFRQLAQQLGNPGHVHHAHPADLVAVLEAAWGARGPDTPPGGAFARPHPGGLPASNPPRLQWAPDPAVGMTWDHLIYAHMIENTRVVEIFRRVLEEYANGERLGVAPEQAQYWLRNTEELFFREGPFGAITSLRSEIRPDAGAIRRNAYYRMFGLDLVHGRDDGSAYPYRKAEVSNRDFVETFEALLREVWVAIENKGNESGVNPRDDGSILNHTARIKSMLTDRRQHGNLAREEFVAVAMLSWFHLALDHNSPIVSALESTASSPYERLRKIGERVGLAAHKNSEDYFRLAEPLSHVLRFIESRDWANAADVQMLYKAPPATNPTLPDDLATIITHWAGATGRSLKSTSQRKAS